MPTLDALGRLNRAFADVEADPRTPADARAVVQLTRSLVHTIDSEFKAIRAHIASTRDDIAALRANDIHTNRLPSADAELGALTRETQEATERLLSEAEAVLDLTPADPAVYKATVDAAMLRIIEACAFHDIAAQRVGKVIQALGLINARVERFADAVGVADAAGDAHDEPRRGDGEGGEAHLANGPAIGGPEIDQEAIDKLFD